MARRAVPAPAGAPRPLDAPAPARDGVLLDTGILVALYNRNDAWHRRATAWLAANRRPLHSVEPVLAEAAFFLPARLRPALAELCANGTIRLHHPDAAGLARIAALLRKYHDADPDWADIALVWAAEHAGLRRIATVDVAGFGTYRIHGRTRFELELLQ